jgi:hypothetical protein
LFLTLQRLAAAGGGAASCRLSVHASLFLTLQHFSSLSEEEASFVSFSSRFIVFNSATDCFSLASFAFRFVSAPSSAWSPIISILLQPLKG